MRIATLQLLAFFLCLPTGSGSEGPATSTASQPPATVDSTTSDFFATLEASPESDESAPRLPVATPNTAGGATSQPPTTVQHLKHADASAVGSVIDRLYSSRAQVPLIAVDSRRNALIIIATPALTKEVQEVIERLDVERLDTPSPSQQQRSQNTDPGPFDDLIASRVQQPELTSHRSGSEDGLVSQPAQQNGPRDAGSRPRTTGQEVERLRQHYAKLNQKALELAAAIRMNALQQNNADRHSARQRLAEAVRSAFAARQQLQRAELAAFQARLRSLQQTINARERIAERVIAHRVDELLNPHLDWSANRPAPIPESGVPSTDPAAAPGQQDALLIADGEFSEQKAGDSVTETAQQGIRVTTPLQPDSDSEELLQQHLSRSGITLLASGVRGVIEGHESNNLVAVLAHNCRLEAITQQREDDLIVLKAWLFVPQGPDADGSNNSLTQRRIDQMAQAGVQFELSGLDDASQTASVGVPQVEPRNSALDLSTPAKTLQLLNSSVTNQNFTQMTELLTDDEAKRTAGMMLQASAMMAAVGGLLSLADDESVDATIGTYSRIPAIVEKHRRADAPPGALMAYQKLMIHATMMVVGQLTDATAQEQAAPTIPSSPQAYSQLLIDAAEILTDPRQFTAETMAAMVELSPSEPDASQPVWEISIDGTHAIAVDTRPDQLRDGSSFSTSQIELTQVNGQWLVSSLTTDESLQEMMQVPQSSAAVEGVPRAAPAFPTPASEATPPGLSIAERAVGTPIRPDDSDPQPIAKLPQTSVPHVPDNAWGPVVEGLRLAVVTADDNTDITDAAQVSCVVRNVSEESVLLHVFAWNPAVDTDVRRTSQEQLQTMLGAVSGMFADHTFTLAPGESRVVASTRIRVTDNPSVERVPENTDLLIIDSKAKRLRNAIYLLRCHLRVRSGEGGEQQIPLSSGQIGLAFGSPASNISQ